MNKNVDSVVQVFAPEGSEVDSYLKQINEYNSRAQNPTNWKLDVYTGADYFEKMLQTKPGNVVVIAGNNRQKTKYIKGAVEAGLNVLADKPLAITEADFEELKDIFQKAKEKGVLVYDIMTERFSTINILQKRIMHNREIFGDLVTGSMDTPAVVSRSVHFFYKDVSGSPIVRPAWYFDVEQEGDGIVDVTTHLIDLIQWSCFPKENIDYKKDVHLVAAKRWPTVLTPSEFQLVTQTEAFPEFLKKDVKDGLLHVFANGEMNYTINGINAEVSIEWRYKAPPGSGDSFYSLRRGTKANLTIRQEQEQNFKPVLYIEPVNRIQKESLKGSLNKSFKNIQKEYPGVSLKELSNGWEVLIPDIYKKGHEEHFADVVQKFTEYLQRGKMPDREVSNLLSKYYTTTQALKFALNK